MTNMKDNNRTKFVPIYTLREEVLSTQVALHKIELDKESLTARLRHIRKEHKMAKENANNAVYAHTSAVLKEIQAGR